MKDFNNRQRKELVGSFLASAVNTLEEILATGSCHDLNSTDVSGIYHDIFAFARIYMAFMTEDLNTLSEDDLAFLNHLESFVFLNEEEVSPILETIGD